MIRTTISESKFLVTIRHFLSMAFYHSKLFFLLILLNIAIICAENTEETLDEPTKTSHTESPTEPNEVDPEEAPQIDGGSSEHANGSICGYCSYCKFCKLCDEDCPCTTSKSKPNCHLCKYCKYCYLCSALCDTVCQPGGFLDTVSSSIWNSLPTFDSKMKEAVDKDIESAKDWIKEYL